MMRDDKLPGPRRPQLRARGQETPPTLQPPQHEPGVPVNVPALRSGTSQGEAKINDLLSIMWTVLRGPASATV